MNSNKIRFQKEGGFCFFLASAVLIGIPEAQLDRDFVAVSYIVYADGTVVYSDACVRNIAALMA